MNEVTKVIAYVRVSDKNETDEKHSIPKQIEQIKAWAKYKGIDESLIEFIEDRKVSGSKSSRKGFQQLIERLESGECSHLVVRDLSRIARRVSIGAVFFEDVIYKNKIIFHSLNDNVDTSTALGKFMLNIILAKDQFYRDDISEKALRSIAKKKANGDKHTHIAPYGYSFVKGKIVPNDEQQEVLRLISSLRSDGLNFPAIRKQLIEKRIKAPQGNTWHLATVMRLYSKYSQV
jgi:site-specific DNA recombinase